MPHDTLERTKVGTGNGTPQRRASFIRRNEAKNRQARILPPDTFKHVPEEPGPQAVTLLEIQPYRCHWPVGLAGGADQLMCGKPSRGTYCIECSRKAYTGEKVLSGTVARDLRRCI